MIDMAKAKTPEPAAVEPEESGPAAAVEKPLPCPGADDGRCIGRPVNGRPCSYHAAYYRPDGMPR